MSATTRFEAEAHARRELARAFDVCGSCRACVEACGVFPSLFARLEHAPGGAGDMTPAEQDELVDSCTSCGRCLVACPYAPGRDESAIDLPAMLRAVAVVGRVAPRVAVASALGARGARWLRARRESWRGGCWRGTARSRVEPLGADTVFVSTCGIEGRTDARRAILDEIARSGRSVAVARPAPCCGAPLFSAGRLAAARRVARRVVSRLAADARRGATLVIAEPTCLRTIAVEYPRALASNDAAIVARAVVDPCEVIDPDTLDVRADADLLYLAPCHVHPRRASPAGADLLRRAGCRVHVVEGCAPGGPSAAADVGECEHASGLPHPLEVLSAWRSGPDWGASGSGS